MRKTVFLFGRFQVPTKGHEEMIRFGYNYAKRIGADFRVYTSKSHDPVKNPLPYQDKIRFLHQLFPGINIVDDPNVKTAFDICRQLSDAGVEDVTMVVGGDRVQEFKNAIGKYVMPRSTPGFDPRKNYAFKNFQVINSGGRKAGVSGTQMREYIRGGKFSEFMKTAPTTDRKLGRAIFATAKKNLREEAGVTRKDFHDKLMSFIDFSCNHLGIDEQPSIHYKEEKGEGQPSFGGYAPGEKKLYVYTKNRHPMDIFRTVAHELVHHKQNLDGRLGKDIAKEGSTGSKIENEANSEAGKIMRYFGAENPFYFDMEYVKESKAIILAGTPGSGKDRILKEAILPHGFTEVSSEHIHKLSPECDIVVSGTSNYNRIEVIKEQLDILGYKTIMVFVNTSDEVSRQRNEARASKGGRVISEMTRFAKWQDAQYDLERFDNLFEKVIEVKNDLDLNQNEKVINETYGKLINSVSKEIEDFAMSNADRRFETMLEQYSDFSARRQNPVGGAGNWGTQKLTNRYAKDTPGQFPGKPIPMKVLDLRRKMKKEQKDPIKGDRLGQEYGFPKGPTMGAPFDDNASIGGPLGDPIGRWMVKEETKRRFVEKYGPLAEQKLRETADRLRESLTDPYSGGMSDVSVTGMPASQPQDMRPDPNAEREKTSLFGKRKQLNKNRKNKSNFINKGK